jgi:hypothetical protein
MYFYVPNITKCIHTQQLREVIFALLHNIIGIFQQITVSRKVPTKIKFTW